MNSAVYSLLISLLWLGQMAHNSSEYSRVTSAAHVYPFLPPYTPAYFRYTKSLRFNIYTFSVTAADTGRVRTVQIKAYRGELLLTNFRIRVDGAVVGAEVADLDNNRFPELYLYSTSDGSGSFGRVYAWQFLPERKADITIPNWQPPVSDGYMGHDSLWVEPAILCRKYPVYYSGDANAEPSGGDRMIRYKLKPVGAGFSLVEEGGVRK